MDIFYQFMELFATFIEGILVITVATKMSGSKYSKRKNISLILIFTIIYTLIVSLMNNWKLFSFATLFICILYTFIITKFTSVGSIILRATSTIISWFAVSAIDYLLSYGLIMIIGKSIDITKVASIILTQGTTRTIFLIVNKLISIAIFVSCEKLYPKLRLLNKQSLTFLFILASFSYIVMSILTSLILTGSLLVLKLAVIISLLFIVLSIVSSIFTVSVNAKHQNDKREMDLMLIANTMMEKNYQDMKSSQSIIRQQVHDFKNHIQTINGMIPDNSPVKEYTDNLISESYELAQLCHCGNDVIDSIINYKKADAESRNIVFTYQILLTSKLTISSVDICAILANQLDNAIEACDKVIDIGKRFIKVEICQKESIIYFKVTNSTEYNPFNEKHDLISTKNNSSSMHGFGIKNIKETAERNNGSLINDYKDGCFISIAMVSNNE